MSKTNLIVPLAAFVLATAVAIAPAGAKSSGGSSHGSSSHSSSHSSSSRSSSHSSSAGHASSAATKTRKPLPAGTHFVRKTCKTASCKAKHPNGNYMIPIKPKKGARPA